MATPAKRKAPQTGPRAAKAGTTAAPVDTDAGITIDGQKYSVSDLEFGELEELEDHIGLPLDAIPFGSVKTMAFLVYLIRRRKEPDYTLEDARKIKISSLNASTDGEANVGDPSQAASE